LRSATLREPISCCAHPADRLKFRLRARCGQESRGRSC
jgi:hypothetical protein